MSERWEVEKGGRRWEVGESNPLITGTPLPEGVPGVE